MTLPSVVRSGRMPNRAWAPPGPIRKPVMTSSKMSSAPSCRVISRRCSRKPGSGAMTPAFATTGSTTTAAICPACSANASVTAVASLNGSTIVSAATGAGTPALPGIASVATPDPASTRSPSEWPWYAPANFTTRSRPVAARASRTALITASVPDDVNRSRSIDGIAAVIASPSSTSAGCVAPSANPSSAAARTASTTDGCACPRIDAPHEPTRSR